MTYVVTAEVEQELELAVDFYRVQVSTSMATAFLNEFTRAARLLDANPGLRRRTTRDRRVFSLRRFPYSLIYRQADDGIRILVVAHHRRRPSEWLGRD